MKGDFSRNTFRPEMHYSGVRMQQGRVQLDADWNEQVDIQAHLDAATRTDVIGRAGTPQLDGQPADETGFAITGSLFIQPGRYYVDGILCENDRPTSLDAQKDLPGVSLPTEAEEGRYLAYLDVWQRHVTALEDGDLREVALHGPDTATRTRTVWQVRVRRLEFEYQPDAVALDSIPYDTFGVSWMPEELLSDGRLAARAEPPQDTTDPCIVPASGGYRRLENQLYRVEIHDGGFPGTATFKWSRDNGILVARVRRIEQPGTQKLIEVDTTGKDTYRRFQPGSWVELTDEGRVLRGEPGEMLKVRAVTGNRLDIEPWTWPMEPRSLPDGEGLTVRLWDSASEDGQVGVLAVSSGGEGGPEWVELEGGVGVRFEQGHYRTGDHWLIPARTVTADILWPREEEAPAFVPPHGIDHHYCALAVLELREGQWSRVYDCRRLFTPLTQQKLLLYAGGDGQESLPDEWLAKPLCAGVFRGQVPVEGARVEFRRVDYEGFGELANLPGESGSASVIVRTDEDGIARCYWRLQWKDEEGDGRLGWERPDWRYHRQSVEARLLDTGSGPASAGGGEVATPLRYSASLSVASRTAYHPQPSLGVLNGQLTVQEALDTLARQRTLDMAGGDGQEALPGHQLAKPLRVRVSRHQVPVPGETVEFLLKSGEGSGLLIDASNPNNCTSGQKTSILVITGTEGIAECFWKPESTGWEEEGASVLRQTVMARLLDRNVFGDTFSVLHAPVFFSASLSVASETAYHPQPGVLSGQGTVQRALDTLADQLQLTYEGGDGQQVLPGRPPQPVVLRAGVSRHQLPVADAAVRFTIVEGDGQLREVGYAGDSDRTVTAKTGSGSEEGTDPGIAQVEWWLDPTTPVQQVEARLVVGEGTPGHLVLRYTARLALADRIAYYPQPSFHVLDGQDTVQKALDALARQRTLDMAGGDGQEAMPGHQLAKPLRVRVSRHQVPVPGETVEFLLESHQGAGLLVDANDPNNHTREEKTSILVITGTEGIAECYWTPAAAGWVQEGSSILRQTVMARLLQRDVPGDTFPVLHAPVFFSASLSVASELAYHPQPGVLGGQGTVQQALDTLADQLQLTYEGGDGQQVFPGQPQPVVLRAGVSRHQLPVAGAEVRFSIVEGDGQLREVGSNGDSDQIITAKTGSGSEEGTDPGIAQVEWWPDATTPVQQVEARLVVGEGVPGHLLLRYTARLALAEHIAYQPAEGSPITVQQALDGVRPPRTFQYVGGDGQLGQPGAQLDAPLEVAVLRGEVPVTGAMIHFRLLGEAPDGLLIPVTPDSSGAATSVLVLTENGVARCAWQLGSSLSGPQQVEARLMEDAEQPSSLPPITFNASCNLDTGVETGVRVERVLLGGAELYVLQNDEVFNAYNLHEFITLLGNGLTIECSEYLQSYSRLPGPVVTLTVDVPYPLTPTDLEAWSAVVSQENGGSIAEPVGFQPLILAGSAYTEGPFIYWRPTYVNMDWLQAMLSRYFFKLGRYGEGPVYFRLKVKGGFIRSEDGTRFLDGEALAGEGFQLALPSGDGRRGGDFELWFSMIRPEEFRAVASGPGGVVELPLPGRVGSKETAASARASAPRTFAGVEQPWGVVRDEKRGELLVADTEAHAIVRCSLQDPAKPVERVTSKLERPTALLLNTAHDELFVADGGNDAIAVFRRTNQGGLELARTIAGKKTGLSGPMGLALDVERNALLVTGSGRAFVTNSASAPRTSKSSFIAVFDAGAKGDVAPRQRVTADDLGLHRVAGIAVDARRRELFVADFGGDAIHVYSLERLYEGGKLEPLRVLQGRATELAQPIGLALRADGQSLWVANARSGAITVYARDAQGNTAPRQTVEVPTEQRKGLRSISM